MALQKDMEEYLARLILKVDNDTKEVLSKYDLKMSFKQIASSMKQCNLDKLRCSAEYLLIESAENYYKDDLIETIIQRIENLLPTVCMKCNKTYAVAISDIPKIVCAVCGQGAHHDCIDELDLTKLDFGFKLVCMGCIPGPKEKKTKKSAKDKAQMEKGKTETNEDIITARNEEQNETNDDTEQIGKITEQEENYDEYAGQQQHDSHLMPICRFHKLQGCKRGNQCTYRHPGMCRKFIYDGNSPNGCNNRSCRYTHPHICKSSWRKRECLVPTCPYYHLKGTARNIQNDNVEYQHEHQKLPYYNQQGFPENERQTYPENEQRRYPEDECHRYPENHRQKFSENERQESYANIVRNGKSHQNTSSLNTDHFLFSLMRQVQETQGQVNAMMGMMQREKQSIPVPVYPTFPKPFQTLI